MNVQLQDFIQWAVGLVLAISIPAYTRWVHGEIKALRTQTTAKTDHLEEELGSLRVQVAAFEATRAALERMENKLDDLTKLVHQMAGRQGIV